MSHKQFMNIFTLWRVREYRAEQKALPPLILPSWSTLAVCCATCFTYFISNWILFILCGWSGLLACTSVHLVFAWCSRKPEEGIWSLGTGVTEGFEAPYQCWELNLGSLEEQPLNHLYSPFILVFKRFIFSFPLSLHFILLALCFKVS